MMVSPGHGRVVDEPRRDDAEEQERDVDLVLEDSRVPPLANHRTGVGDDKEVDGNEDAREERPQTADYDHAGHEVGGAFANRPCALVLETE